MSIYGHSGPEDELPDDWKLLEQRITHRQGHLTASDCKRLYQATSYVLAMYHDEGMCVCDSGDSSVGIPPTVCEAHMLAHVVEQIIYSQRPRRRMR